MMQEYQALRLVESHPCVGKAFGLFQDSDFFHIEMEFYEGGDFTKLALHAAEACVLTTEAWWGKVFKQCLEGLRHVHSKGIIHCDIKEPNLMIRNRKYHEPSVVIVDFGISQAEGVSRPTPYGTPGYIPPEVWRTLKWHTSGDLFSLGVVILQMMIGRTPTEKYPGRGVFVNSRSLEEVAQATSTQEPPIGLMPSSYQNLKSLASQLLQKDARYRPSAHEALCGNWMVQLNNDTLSTSAVEPARAQILGNDTSKIASAGVGSSTAPENHHIDNSDSWFPAIAASSVLPFLLLALL
jgi:serine/threonine protein kinase